MREVLDRISKIGIVPVVVLEDAAKAVSVAKSLAAGGIDCAEVTFRTAAAEESIRRIEAECPEILLGAGTVLTTEQVDKAVAAGAKFIVTPGYNPKVVNYCVEKGIPIVPGCMDTNAIEMALEAGLDTVKFFPAEAAGGLPMMKALAGPYVNLKFIPTGGVSKDNLNEYLSFKKIIACGGSWMVKGDLVKQDRYDEIERLSRDAVAAMLDLKVSRIVTGAGEAEGLQAPLLAGVLGFAEAESCVEITTTSLKQAMYHLEKQGAAFCEPNGKEVCLKQKVNGMTVKLKEK